MLSVQGQFPHGLLPGLSECSPIRPSNRLQLECACHCFNFCFRVRIGWRALKTYKGFTGFSVLQHKSRLLETLPPPNSTQNDHISLVIWFDIAELKYIYFFAFLFALTCLWRCHQEANGHFKPSLIGGNFLFLYLLASTFIPVYFPLFRTWRCHICSLVTPAHIYSRQTSKWHSFPPWPQLKASILSALYYSKHQVWE